MPFNRLLFGALEEDCSHTEQGVTVGLTSRRNTAILLFKLDKHAAESRAALGLSPGEKLCDLLFYIVARGPQGGAVRRLLCLVECKGADIDTAVAQLQVTEAAVQKKLRPELCKRAEFMLAVRSNRGSAPERKRREAKNVHVFRKTEDFEKAVFARLT